MKTLKKNQKIFFKKNGYLVVENLIKKSTINKLRKISYDLFKGKYKTQIAPDKIKSPGSRFTRFMRVKIPTICPTTCI